MSVHEKKKNKTYLFFSSCGSKSVDSLNESSGKDRIVKIVLKTKTLSPDLRSSLDYVCNLDRQPQPSQHKLSFLGKNFIALLRNSLPFFFPFFPPRFIYLFSLENVKCCQWAHLNYAFCPRVFCWVSVVLYLWTKGAVLLGTQPCCATLMTGGLSSKMKTSLAP